MEYREALKRIDEIQQGGDYFKSVLQLGELAQQLVSEIYGLQIRVGMLEEHRDYWKKCYMDAANSKLPKYKPEWTARNSEEWMHGNPA